MTTMPTFAVPKHLAEVARLMEEHPLVDVMVDQVDGRQVRIGGQWLADFASCNYLGFDLDPEILAGVPGFLAEWGTHPSWSRALASPALYRRVEEEVAELLGVEDVLAFPTLTHTHSGVLPALAGAGTVLLDLRAHRTIHDAAEIARGRGRWSGASATMTSSTPGACCGRRPGGRRWCAWTGSTP